MGRKKNERSFQQEVFDMIGRETGNTHIIAAHQEILRFAGDLETGIFLSQLIYWADKGAREDGFLFKTLDEWRAETGLSVHAIRRATKKLKQMGILETKIKKANGFPTIHYQLQQNALIDAFLRKHKNRFCENRKSMVFAKTKKHKHRLPQNTETYINKGDKFKFVSFFSYKKEFLKEDTEEIMALEYYVSAFKRNMGAEHPPLAPTKWQELLNNIMGVYDPNTNRYFDIELNCFRLMVDRHFETTYQDGCDYNILHFNTDGVKSKRYYEAEKCF